MLTKKDAKMAQGLAILAMVCLHLFCQKVNLPYKPLLWIGSTPLVYYIGLFGDMCVPIYCFCSGYAQSILVEKQSFVNRISRLGKFIFHFQLVVCLFSCVGICVHNTQIPGSLPEFFGNVFLYRLTYNGAWWFVLTYIILVIAAAPIYKIVQKSHPVFVFLSSGLLYFVSYIFRFVHVLTFQNTVIEWIWTQFILFGTSQFSFVAGMLFYRYQWLDKLRFYMQKYFFAKISFALIPFFMIVLHGIEQSLIIAPITGLTTLICFHLWKKPIPVEKTLLFLGHHSTNIWLVHMFFYLVLFDGFAFIAQFPLFVLIFMLSVCMAISYVIDGLEWIVKYIFKRTALKSKMNL